MIWKNQYSFTKIFQIDLSFNLVCCNPYKVILLSCSKCLYNIYYLLHLDGKSTVVMKKNVAPHWLVVVDIQLLHVTSPDTNAIKSIVMHTN